MTRAATFSEVVGARRTTLSKRSTRKLTKEQLRALAPRVPASAQALYLRAIARVFAALRADLAPRVAKLLEEVAEYVRVDAEREDIAIPGPVIRRLGELQVAISARLSEQRMGAAIAEAGRAVYAHNTREMARVLPLSVRRLTVGEAAFVQRFVRRNVGLITQVSSAMRVRLTRAIGEATAGQIRVETLAKQLEETFGFGESRAELIARDQTLKANADLTRERQTGAGITEYTWSTSNDERVRGNPSGKYPDSDSDHFSLDGTRQRWDSPPITNAKTSERNHPGSDFSCRCTAVPVVDALLGPDD